MLLLLLLLLLMMMMMMMMMMIDDDDDDDDVEYFEIVLLQNNIEKLTELSGLMVRGVTHLHTNRNLNNLIAIIHVLQIVLFYFLFLAFPNYSKTTFCICSLCAPSKGAPI